MFISYLIPSWDTISLSTDANFGHEKFLGHMASAESSHIGTDHLHS